MTLDVISEICNTLPSVTTDIKWEDHLCFNINEKMFFISSLDQKPTSASFKVSPEDFDLLVKKEGIIPAPYLARYKWVKIDDIQRLNKKEWTSYIEKSFYLVASKLSKKRQKELGIIS